MYRLDFAVKMFLIFYMNLSQLKKSNCMLQNIHHAHMGNTQIGCLMLNKAYECIKYAAIRLQLLF